MDYNKWKDEAKPEGVHDNPAAVESERENYNTVYMNSIHSIITYNTVYTVHVSSFQCFSNAVPPLAFSPGPSREFGEGEGGGTKLYHHMQTLLRYSQDLLEWVDIMAITSSC